MAPSESLGPAPVRGAGHSVTVIAIVAHLLLLPPSGAEADSLSLKALRIAAGKRGSLYRYGAQGPHRFDCSGLTYYAFQKAGREIPRTAQAQYWKTVHKNRSSRVPGDLVFFHRRGAVYHVGIYSGRNMIWHAPRPGRVVQRETIWTNQVWYGHVP
ncbi:C40 family peptidase [Streptomyces sp. NPDC001262]|uniref:C40 family peptidase n=1 Tax=Streptomyces sp. NPDC001262 TaxID=3364552 RepID=UPI0036978080